MDIEHVLQEHAEHMATVRRQAFLSVKDAQGVFREVEALLHRLRMEYKLGSAEETPMARYLRCLKGLEALHATLPAEGRPPITNLRGMMYELVKRGLHSFERDA